MLYNVSEFWPIVFQEVKHEQKYSLLAQAGLCSANKDVLHPTSPTSLLMHTHHHTHFFSFVSTFICVPLWCKCYMTCCNIVSINAVPLEMRHVKMWWSSEGIYVNVWKWQIFWRADKHLVPWGKQENPQVFGHNTEWAGWGGRLSLEYSHIVYLWFRLSYMEASEFSSMLGAAKIEIKCVFTIFRAPIGALDHGLPTERTL